MPFEPSKRTSNFSYAIRDLIPYAREVEASGKKVLKLNIGDPLKFDFDIPEVMLNAVSKDLVKSGAYGRSEGNIEACKALAEKYSVKIDDIRIGNGASEVIANFFGAYLKSGMEVLLPAPDYPLYTSYVNYFGGKPVHYLCNENNDWQPDIKDIESKITEKTAVIVVINPNNPTGALYSKEVLEQIINLAKKHGLLILSDEVYEDLIFEDKQLVPMASLSKSVPIFTVGSLSKRYLVPGWRCGWMIRHDPENKTDELWEAITKLCRARLSANTIAQLALPEALKLGKNYFDSLVGPEGRLTKRREALMKGLKDIPGLSCVKPQAAFYAFPKIESIKGSDKDFVINFLKQEGVLVVHGSGFFYPDNKHIRIVFLPSAKDISSACQKLKKFIASIDKK